VLKSGKPSCRVNTQFKNKMFFTVPKGVSCKNPTEAINLTGLHENLVFHIKPLGFERETSFCGLEKPENSLRGHPN